MSRPIKFRAWDIEENRMRFDILIPPPDDLSDPHEYWIYIGSTGEHGYIDRKRIILMQFTGLKDKTGKEIWEGDVLGDDEDFKAAVEFHDGAFHWDRFALAGLNIKAGGLEVLGNVHENRDILK